MMKLKYIYVLIIGIVMCICIYGITQCMVNDNDSEKIEIPTNKSGNIVQVRATVMKDYIASEITLEGVVDSGIYGEHEKCVSVAFDENCKASELEMMCYVGEEIKAEEVVFVIGENEYRTNYTGRISAIEVTKEEVVVVISDYEALVIR